MTNYENLLTLTQEEMARFLDATTENCRACMFFQEADNSCQKTNPLESAGCLEGMLRWLALPTKDRPQDVKLFDWVRAKEEPEVRG